MTRKKLPNQDDILQYLESPIPFAQSGYIWYHDTAHDRWAQFKPWPHQLELLHTFATHPKTAVPKARQNGVTTTMFVFILWTFIFKPIAAIGYFSIGGREAREALRKVRGMYRRLPHNIIAANVTKSDQVNGIFQVEAPDGTAEGSIIYSLPSTGGESLTFTTVIFDEAGRAPGYSGLVARVMPTVEDAIGMGTGRVVACGIFDKAKPNEKYRKQILDGISRRNGWRTIFLPWWSRPDRTPAWFESICEEMDDDDRKQQYPETVEEMLSAREADRRISGKLTTAVCVDAVPLVDNLFPALPNLQVFEPPQEGVSYVATADPAGGTPTSDESVTCIAKALTGQQVAIMGGQWRPEIHAGYSAELCRWYNAPILPERNNHGMVFLSTMDIINADDPDDLVEILDGHDDKPGWWTGLSQKVKMYHSLVDLMTDAKKAGMVLVRDEKTRQQLEKVQNSDLKAPKAEHDDRAVAYALVSVAIEQLAPKVGFGLV